MKEENGYYVWKKNDVYKFNQYFTTKEFDCQCKLKECIEQKASKLLISKLTELREAVNEPLRITSGFRCAAHQEEIRKSGVSTVVAKVSTHQVGDAADVQPSRISIKDFETIASKFFNAIGIAKTFLHFDLRGLDDGKIRRWPY